MKKKIGGMYGMIGAKQVSVLRALTLIMLMGMNISSKKDREENL